MLDRSIIAAHNAACANEWRAALDQINGTSNGPTELKARQIHPSDFDANSVQTTARQVEPLNRTAASIWLAAHVATAEVILRLYLSLRISQERLVDALR